MKKILNKIKYYYNYIIANYLKRKEIDNGNNCFTIMSDEELVDKIINGKSYSRFGDGELSLICNNEFKLNFQNNNELLRNKLKEVLNSNLDNLIIGINYSFNNPNIYNKKVQKYCRTFNYLYRDKYKKIIPLDKVYGNSSITRFYIDYDNSGLSGANYRINNLKRIWNNKKVLIVEGDKTKLGVGNDLFSNCLNIRRIIVPSINAFEAYNNILNSIKQNVAKNEIVLMAVGPTATVLAYDLAKIGIHSVDIGHIDIEYEWMKLKAKKRVAIKGKYVNEIRGKKYIESSNTDSNYLNSIIDRI